MTLVDLTAEAPWALCGEPHDVWACGCGWMSGREVPGEGDGLDGLEVDPYLEAPPPVVPLDVADVDLAGLAPKRLLARAQRERQRREDAERETMRLAVEWAHSHPVCDKDGQQKSWRVSPAGSAGSDELAQAIARVEARLEAREITSVQAERQIADLHDWHGIPAVAWDAPASFAAAVGLSTFSGKLMIRDALIVCHRLPKVWEKFTTLSAGQVPAKRVRLVAQLLVGQPADVCRAADTALARIITTVGPVKLEHTITEIITRLDVEAREAEAEDAEDTYGVSCDEADAARTGTATLEVRGDVVDLRAFNQMVGLIAEILKQQGCQDPLGVRRARAVGILADPHRAAALLDGVPTEDLPKPRRETTLYVHIPLGVLVGLYVMGRCEALGPVLEAMVRRWCGRSDTNLTVRPVIDLNDHLHSTGYQPSETLREQVTLTNDRCVFAYCTRRGRCCDQDHIVPHGDDGPTCSCNLAPLCRHHHLLKTHAGWDYTRLDETTFLWTDPHGLTYLRTVDGTRILDDPTIGA